MFSRDYYNAKTFQNSKPKEGFFKILVAAKQETLAAISSAPSELAVQKKLLEEKEKQLHDIKRSARDKVLESVLTDLGLPGKTSSGVMGIPIDYDKVQFKFKEKDGSLHQLEDHVTDTSALETEISELRANIERLTRLVQARSDRYMRIV